jgi:DNA adenine methylase
MMQNKELTNGSSSPLRYPGGKGKITRFVGKALEMNGINGTYVEPFAGGAGIAINLILANKVKRILINDLDDGVFAFWSTVIKEPEYILKKIQAVPFDYCNPDALSPEEYHSYWNKVKRRFYFNHYSDIRQKGFDFFMLNRMNVSGIIKGGPIGGKNQNGRYNISARFNKATLQSQICKIAEKADSIFVTNLEASHFCRLYSEGKFGKTENSLVFVDPPYYVQGRNLYNYYATDRIHTLIAEQLLAANTSSSWKWILTYDEAKQINQMYPNEQVNKYEYGINYSANKRGRFLEYLFTSNDLEVQSFSNVELSQISA